MSGVPRTLVVMFFWANESKTVYRHGLITSSLNGIFSSFERKDEDALRSVGM